MTNKNINNVKQKDQEIWRDISDHNGRYQVSNLGSIRSYMRGDVPYQLTPSINTKGYLGVSLYKNKVEERFLVHRLVAIEFIPNTNHKPHINHIDGNKKNNEVDNLEWVNPTENSYHACKNELMKPVKGELHGRAKTTREEVLEMRSAYQLGCFTYGDLADAYSLSRSSVYDIISRNTWQHI